MPSATTSDDPKYYLLLKDMKVNRANAMPSPYIAGLPSMYGIVSMAKHLVERVLKDLKLIFYSVAVSIHHFSMSGSQQKYPCYSLRDIKKNQELRIITARDSWFTASIIIKVSLKTGQRFDNAVNWLDQHRHLDGLYSLRFCGGGVLYPGGIPNVTLIPHKLLPVYCKKLDGFLIADRIELCRSYKEPGEDALDTMLRVIEQAKDYGLGWLVPLAVGFKGVSKPQYKKYTRTDLPHLNAEPVLGLGRLFLARAAALTYGEGDTFFWKPDSMPFLVSGSI